MIMAIMIMIDNNEDYDCNDCNDDDDDDDGDELPSCAIASG